MPFTGTFGGRSSRRSTRGRCSRAPEPAHLLQRPDVEVTAADLLDATGDSVAAARGRLGAEPVLDDRARAAPAVLLGSNRDFCRLLACPHTSASGTLSVCTVNGSRATIPSNFRKSRSPVQISLTPCWRIRATR